MSENRKSYLVVRESDGLGEIFAIHEGQRYTLGRAITNEIVLKDNMCSRQHAEISFDEDQWRLRDCGSMNGTRVNDEKLEGERILSPGDEIGLGHTLLIFINELAQLPTMQPVENQERAGVSIKKRLGQTRYELPAPLSSKTPPPAQPHRISRDLSILYSLALEMGSAASADELTDIVLNGLLDATPADVGGIFRIQSDAKPASVAQRSHLENQPILEPHDHIVQEVLRTREGILAEDSSRLTGLRGDDPDTELLSELPGSVICAPVVLDGTVHRLIYLCCFDPMKALGSEDLEFTVAVGKQLAVVTKGLLRQQELSEENQRLKAQVSSEIELIGESEPIRAIETQIARVAATNATVLVRGESGVGKELVARALHLAGSRRQNPLVCLNCAALTESLLESELFGHEKGAFTGATERKIGKFEAADGGTIFLDEIGEMPAGAQSKLLRILEGHPYERVGGHEPISVNVRVVAATNRPLEDAVSQGLFRRDLYFRLQVVELDVPPLRERPSDIPLLAEHFLGKFLLETGRKIRGFSPEALKKMQEYHWPGNVRELRNVVERAVALSTGQILGEEDIWLSSLEQAARSSPVEKKYQPRSIEEIEKLHVGATLAHTGWNKSQAAGILGIERSTLDRKIKNYEITKP